MFFELIQSQTETVMLAEVSPDMALQTFARAIMNDEPITVFNNGKHRRDFTYIDDIVEGSIRVLDRPASPNPKVGQK